tara:strand:- start:33122 stop:33367 length:246 start_codon:yes stop_codon:yes gene_type:complete
MNFIPKPVSELGRDREVMKAEDILCTGRSPREDMVRSQFKLLVRANHPDCGTVKSEILTMDKLQWAKKILLKEVERRNERR